MTFQTSIHRPGVSSGIGLRKYRGFVLTSFAAVFTSLLFATPGLKAQLVTNTWSTNPPSSNFNTADDWVDNAVPASSTNTRLWFTNSSTTALNNDISSLTINGINFTTNAGAFTIGGNTITLAQTVVAGTTNNPFISNSSASTETFNAAITLAPSISATYTATIVNSSSNGAMVFNGAINAGTNSLTIGGKGNQTYNGVVTYTGTNQVTIAGGGTTTIGNGGSLLATNNPNAYITFSPGGQIDVLNVATGGTLANSNLVLMNATTSGSFNIFTNSGSVSLNKLNLYGSGSGSTNSFVQGAGTASIGTIGIGQGNTVTASNTSLLNSVQVTGGLLTNSGVINLGFNGNGSTNRLTITGGQLISAQGLYFGVNSASAYTSTNMLNQIILGGGTATIAKFGYGTNTAASGLNNTLLWSNAAVLQAGGNQNASYMTTSTITGNSNLAVTMGTNGGVFDVKGFTNTIAVNIADGTANSSGSLTVTNATNTAGQLTLSGNNSFSGLTLRGSNATVVLSSSAAAGSTNGSLNLGAGALNIGANNLTNSAVSFGNGVLSGTGTLTAGSGGVNFTNSVNQTITNSLVSTGGLTNSGSATTTLSASNSITGPVAINGGTLVLGSANGLGTNRLAVTVNNGTLNLGSTLGASPFNVSSLTLSGNGAVTLTNTISSTGSIDITGTGNVINWAVGGLSGGNTYTIMTGSNVTGASSNSLALNNQALGISNLSFGGTYTSGLTSYTFTTNSTSLLLSVVADVANFFWTGAAGNNSWDYTSTNFATNGGPNVAFPEANNAIFTNAAAVTVTNTGVTAGSVTVSNASGTVGLTGGNLTATGLSVSGGGAFNAGNNLTVSGAVGVSNNSSATLSGTNSLSGGISLGNGQIVVASATALGGGSAITVAGSGTIAASGNQTVSNAVAISSGTATLDSAGNALTESGAISGSGALSVTNSTGTGTVSLTGSNSYTGGSTVNGGTLQVGRTNALGASSNALAVNSTLDLNGYSFSQGALTGSGTVTSGVASNSTLTVGNGNASSTFSGLITNGSGTVSLTKVGTGTLVLASSQGYTGATNSGAAGTTINAGTVFASNSYVFANNGNGKNVPTINGGGTLIFGATNTTNNLNGGMNWYTAGSYGLNSTQGIAQLIITNGAVVNANAALYIGTGLVSAGTASTATNILSVGPGSTLSNSSLINVGAIGQTVSILTNNGGTITTASVFGVGRGASNTLSAYYQSSGSLTAATLSFGYNSATNVVGHNATNQFNLNGGTVSVSGIGFNSDGSNNLNQLTIGGGTFTSAGGIGWGGSTNSVYTNPTGTNVIQLNGGLFVENGTYMNASASPAMSNQLNFNGGALQSSTNQAIITNIAVSLQAGGGTIDASNNSINVQAAVSGSGALSVNGLGGTGVVTLSGSNSYNGPTTVRSGTLLVNGNNTASAVTVSNSATLGGTGSAGAVTLNTGSTITPGNPGTSNSVGTLTVSSMVWNAGGNYNWMLQNATNSAGVGYSTISGTGGLDLTSLNSSSPFNINLWTLTNNGTSGSAAAFDSSSNYSWTLASFAGGITNFNAANFAINTGATNGTGGFANGLDGGGTFGITTNSTNLLLTYFVTTPAGVGTITVSQATNAYITGGSNSFTYTVQNSGGSAANFTGAATTNITGTVASTNIASGATSGPISGFALNSTNLGSQTGTFTVATTNGNPASGTGTVAVDVYDHAAGSLSGTNLALSNWISGYTGAVASTNSVTLTNAAGVWTVNLGANDATGLIGGATLTQGTSTNLTAGAANATTAFGSTPGTISSNVAITLFDASPLNGATTNGTTNVNVTGTVYGHAAGSLSGTNLSLGSWITGYSGTVSNTNTVTLSNAAGTWNVALGATNGTGLIGGATLTQGTSTNLTASVANATNFGSGIGSFSSNVAITLFDASTLNGATNNGTTNVSVTGNVYGHAAGSLSGTNLSLGSWITGYSGTVSNTNTVTLSNAAGAWTVNLGATNGSGLIGGATLTQGTSTNLTASATASTFAGSSTGTVSSNVAITFFDASTLNGAATNGTTNVNVTASVYDHALGSLTNSNVALNAVHVGYTNAQTNQVGVSNAVGFRVSLATLSNSSSNGLSLGSVTNVVTNSSSNAALVFAIGQANTGRFTNTIAVVYRDASTLDGASSTVGTNFLTVTGQVYSGQATWTNSGSGNWTSLSNWDANGGTPGLDGTLSANDTATFDTNGSGTVVLNTNAALNALTFSNSSASYTLNGTGTISLVQGSNAPSITDLAGSHTISNGLIFAADTTITNANGTLLTLAGNNGGAGGLTKNGTGTLVLSGTNTNQGLINLNGGLTLVRGVLSNAASTAIDGGAGLLLTNGGVMTIDSLDIGFSGVNSLNVAASSTLTSGNVQVGASSFSSNNSITISGAGARWNATDITFGQAAAGNTLSILAGGSLIVAENVNLGSASTSSNNSIFVDGANSLLSSGTLTIGNAGSGTVTVANGAVISASSIIIGTNGDLDFGRYQGNDSAGSVVGNITFTGSNSPDYGINFNQTNTLNFSNTVSGNGWICQLGTGTTVVSASNSYTQFTGIDAGTLVASNAHALGAGSVTIDGGVSGAALNFALTNSTLYLGGLSMTSNSTVSLAKYSTVTNTAGVMISGSSNYLSIGGGSWGTNTYTLLSGTSLTLSNALSGIYLVGDVFGSGSVTVGGSKMGGRSTYEFNTNATSLYMTVTGGAFDLVWSGVANDQWSTNSSATNWKQNGSGSDIAFVTDDNVTFGNSATLVPIVVASGGVTSGTISVTNTSGQVILTNGAINGFSFTNSGNGSLTVFSVLQLTNDLSVTGTNQATFATNVSASSLSMNGGGTLSLLGSNSIGSSTITAGVIAISNNASFGTGSLTFAGNGTVTALADNLRITNATVVNSGLRAIYDVQSYTMTNAAQISGAGGVTMAGNGTLVLAASNSYAGGTLVTNGTLALTNSGTLGSSSGSVTISNTGMIDLSNCSVTNGSFAIGGGTLTGSGTLTAATYQLNGGTVAANLGVGSITVGGSSTLSGTAGASNVNIGTGTLVLSGSNRFVNSAVVSNNGGTLDLGSTNQGVGGLLGTGSVTNGGGTLSIVSSGSNSFGGVISGAGALVLGGGTQTLSGSNTYSGGTLITNGTLALGTTNALITNGSVTVTNAGVLNLGGFNQTLAGLYGTGVITNTGASTLTLSIGSSTNNTFGGQIVGSNALTIGGAGTVTLTNSNSYTGGTLVTNGTLVLTNSGTMGATNSAVSLGNGTINIGGGNRTNASFTNSGGALNGTGTLTAATYQLNGGTIAANLGTGSISVGGSSTLSGTAGASNVNIGTGTLVLSGSNRFVNSAVVSNNGGTLDLGSTNQGVGGLLGTGSVTNGGGTLSIVSSGSNSYGGVISGAGALVLGGGTQTLSGSNTYSGGTLITNSTLALGTNGALLGTGTVTVTNAGVLNLGGFNQTLAGLYGTGVITNTGASTLTLNVSSTNNTFGGQIVGSNALTIGGAGTVTLTNSNSYTGGTLLTNGTLVASNARALGNGTLTLTNANSTLNYAVGNSTLTLGGLVMSGGTTLSLAQGSSISNSNTVTFSGSTNFISLLGSWQTTGTNVLISGSSISGYTNYSALVYGSSTVSFGGSFTNSGWQYTFTTNSNGGVFSLDLIAIQLAANLYWQTNVASGTWNTNATNTPWTTNTLGSSIVATNFTSNANVTFLSGASVTNTAGVTAGAITVTNGAGTSLALLGSGTINANSFTNAGTGTLTVSNTLLITNELAITAANSSTFSTNVTAGSLSMNGAGTLVLLASNTFGSVAMTNGTVSVGNSNSLGSGSVSLNNASLTSTTGLTFSNDFTLVGSDTVTASNALTLSGKIGGAGTLTKAGSSTLTLSGSNSYGGTVINGGTLVASNANALASNSVAISGGSVLSLATNVGAGTVTLASGTISGSGTLTGSSYLATNGRIEVSLAGNGSSLTESGPGTLTLTANNVYNGGTTVTNGGTLVASNANALGGGTATISSNSTLNLAGINQTLAGLYGSGSVTNTGASTLSLSIGSGMNNTFSGVISGSGGVTMGGAGTLTLSNTNTYTGLTTISNGGTVVLGTNNALAAGSSLLITDGVLSNTYSENFGSGTVTVSSGSIAGSGTLSASAFVMTNASVSNSLNGSTLSVSNGTVTLGGSNALTGAVTVGNGTLTASSLGTGALTLSNALFNDTNASTLNIGALTLSGNSIINFSTNMMSSGSVIISNTGNLLNYTGSLGSTGTNNLISGTNVIGATALGISLTNSLFTNTLSWGSNTVVGRNTYLFTNSIVGGTNSLAVIVSGAGAFNLVWTGAQDSNWNTTATNWKQNGAGSNIAFQSQDNVTFTNSATVNVGNTVTAGVMLVSNNSGLISFSGAGTISATSFTNTGSGNLLVSNSLSLGSGTLVNIGSGSVTLAGNYTSGALQMGGTGTLSLNASNSYAGGTVITNGVVDATATNYAIGSGSVTVNGGQLLLGGKSNTVAGVTLGSGTIAGSNNGLLTATNGFSVTNGLISANLGGGTLTQSGGGTVTLSGSNSYAGTVLNGGTLVAATNGALGGTNVTVNAGTLSVSNANVSAGVVTLGNGTISGSGTLTGSSYKVTNGLISASLGGGSLTQSGGGTVTLSNSNNLTGTVLNGGTFVAATNGALGGTNVTVNSGTLSVSNANVSAGVVTLGNGTISGSGTLTGSSYNVTNNALISASLGGGSLTQSGGGTLTLSNSNNLTGTVLNGGTLALGANNALGTNGTLTINNNSTLTIGSYTNAFSQLTLGNGTISGSGTLSASTGFNLSNGVVNASLAGAGSLTIDGTGTVTLGAANTYQGETYVGSNVAVIVTTNGAFSTNTITTEQSITFTNSSSTITVSNTIAGNTNATITQSGGGTLALLSTINTFGGAATVANGTIAFTSGASNATSAQSLGTNSNVFLGVSGTNNNATLLYTNGSGSTTLAKNVNALSAGTNTIEIGGTGTLTLSGNLNKNGTLLMLRGSSTNSVFNITGTITGSLTNSDLVYNGATYNVNSSNTYNGPTYLVNGAVVNANSNGALPVSSNGFSAIIMDQTGTGSSTLNLGTNQSVASLTGLSSSKVNLSNNILTISNSSTASTANFAGAMGGNGGSLIYRGGNMNQILSGSNSYTGGTLIQSGTLTANNRTALGSGSVSLSGGTLALQQQLDVSTFNWSNAGTIALQSSGAFLNVTSTSNNALTLNGTNGFTFNVAGLGAGSHTLLAATNLSSTNGFSISEFGVTGIGSGFSYTLNLLDGSLLIDLVQNVPVYPNFSSYAVTPNQLAVATVFNTWASNNPTGDQTNVLSALTALTNNPAAMQEAFNAVQPTIYQSLGTLAFNSANAQNMELVQRLWGQRIASGGGFTMSGFADNTPIWEGQGDGNGYKDPAKDVLRPGPDNRWSLFVDGNGIFAQANSGNMLPNYNAQGGGVTAGVSFRVNPTVNVGVYTGYEGTYAKYNGGSSMTDNSVRFGVFGTYGKQDGKGLYADAAVGGGYNNYQVTRSIQFPGLSRTANSTPGAGELDSILATGYNWKKGNWTYGPTTSMQYTYLGVNGMNETGAQSLNITSGGWNTASLLYSLGAQAAYTWQATKDLVVVPQINASWQHEFLQNPYAINGTMGGVNFANLSSAPLRDFLYAGLGVTLEFKERWFTSIFYNAAAGNSDLQSQNIFWSFGCKF